MPNNLPQGWVKCLLKDIAIVKGGKRLPAGAKYSEIKTDYPYIRVTNFDKMTVNTNDLKYLTPEIQNKIKNYTITKDDIYISIAGSIGKVGIIPDELDGANLTENAAKIIHSINKKFLTYILNSSEIQNQISTYTKSTTQPKLALYRIEELKIQLPPLNEQRRIVGKIESEFAKIDEGLEHLENAKEQIKQYRQSVLKSAFDGKLTQQNPDDESAEILLQKINPKASFKHNDKLPQGWVECQLGEVFDIRDGTHDSPKYHDIGYPLVTSKNLKNGLIDLENVSLISEKDYNKINERSKVSIGDILFAMIGTIGNPVIIVDEPQFAIKNVALFKYNNLINNKYLKYFLESPKTLNIMHSQAKGSTQKFVGLGYLRTFIFPVCPLNEQRLIVEEIEKRFAVADEVEKVVEQNIEKSKQLKQSILKKAFEGRLVPQDPTDEPASILLEKIKQERSKK